MPRSKSILILLLLFLPLCLFSQSKVISDLRLRGSVKAEKEIVNDLDAFIESEIVMEQDISAMGKVFAEAGLEYSLLKNFSLEGKYRFSKNRKSTSDEFKYTHMVALAAQYGHKIERFKLYYRLQYQNIDEDAWEAEGIDENSNVFKTRFKVKYSPPKSKIDVFASTELYVSPGYDVFVKARKLKSYLGVEYDIGKNTGLKIYYRNDSELVSYLPYMFHTFGVAFSFEL
jgi:hypothetical protein